MVLLRENFLCHIPLVRIPAILRTNYYFLLDNRVQLEPVSKNLIFFYENSSFAQTLSGNFFACFQHLVTRSICQEQWPKRSTTNFQAKKVGKKTLFETTYFKFRKKLAVGFRENLSGHLSIFALRMLELIIAEIAKKLAKQNHAFLSLNKVQKLKTRATITSSESGYPLNCLQTAKNE